MSVSWSSNQLWNMDAIFSARTAIQLPWFFCHQISILQLFSLRLPGSGQWNEGKGKVCISHNYMFIYEMRERHGRQSRPKIEVLNLNKYIYIHREFTLMEFRPILLLRQKQAVAHLFWWMLRARPKPAMIHIKSSQLPTSSMQTRLQCMQNTAWP